MKYTYFYLQQVILERNFGSNTRRQDFGTNTLIENHVLKIQSNGWYLLVKSKTCLDDKQRR